VEEATSLLDRISSVASRVVVIKILGVEGKALKVFSSTRTRVGLSLDQVQIKPSETLTGFVGMRNLVFKAKTSIVVLVILIKGLLRGIVTSSTEVIILTVDLLDSNTTIIVCIVEATIVVMVMALAGVLGGDRNYVEGAGQEVSTDGGQRDVVSGSNSRAL
jgi:hypothetical protein